MPLVSVIVPIYNVEKYLIRCLDSVLAQTFTDFEVICVNDGSTDGCAAILENYAKRSSQIKIITQENQGLSMARNNGLKATSGDFIVFVDSDDYVDSSFLEDLVQAAFQTKSEIVMTGTRYCKPDSVEDKKTSCGTYYSFRDKIKYLPHGGCWNKIYKKSFLEEHHLTFPRGLLYEDNPFTIQALYYCQSFTIINGGKYNYCVNPNSILFDANKEQKRKNDSLVILGQIWDFVSAKCSCQDKLCVFKFCCDNFIPLSFLEDKEYYKKVYNITKFNSILLLRRFKIFKRYAKRQIQKFFTK